LSDLKQGRSNHAIQIHALVGAELDRVGGSSLLAELLQQLVDGTVAVSCATIATTGWLLLVVFQSLSIHRGWRARHRQLGRAIFVLAPLFMAGALLVMATMLVGQGPFDAMFTDRLVALDIVTTLTFAWLIFEALRSRRQITGARDLHAGNDLAGGQSHTGAITARICVWFDCSFARRVIRSRWPRGWKG